MSARTIEIFVEADDEIPEDCVRRFQAVEAPRAVHRIRYEPDDGPEATWRVFGKQRDGSSIPAFAAGVDDSGEGTSTLIYGGDAGLRLESEDGTRKIAEPFLLLTPDAVLD
jgi:hypothetical protein